MEKLKKYLKITLRFVTIQTTSFCSPLLVSSRRRLRTLLLFTAGRYLGTLLTPLTATTTITAAVPRDYCAVSPAVSTTARRGQHARL